MPKATCIERCPMCGNHSGRCPRCGNPFIGYASLSHKDNETYVCNDCGHLESMESMDIGPPYNGPIYWSTKKEQK